MIQVEERAAAAPQAGARAIYVAICSGADLAALVPLIATRLRDEPRCSFLILYGHCGSVSDAALEELLALKDRYLERLALHFIMDREPEEGELLNGRLDAHKLRDIAAQLFEPLAVHEFFLAGADSAIAELRAQLARLGVAPEKIRAATESQGEPVARERPAPAEPATEAAMTQVTVIMDGRRRAFAMRTGTESVLEAAARAGLDLPFSCRAGVCSTCRTKLVRGEVELAQNYALEDWELAQGFILACQAHAKTPELEITYDET